MSLFDQGILDEPSLPASPLVSPEESGGDQGGVVRLLVAYDGTDFHGFAAQPDVPTVGGALVDAIEKVLGEPAEISCAGRTDMGVHARGQVVSFRPGGEVDLQRLQDALNSMLGPLIVVRECSVAEPDFDARHSARWRKYRYTVVNRPDPDPFLARYAWWVPRPLDLRALRLGADPLIGEHDFASFCRKGQAGSTTVRTVLDSSWSDEGEGVLVYEVRASAFCWQMVRSIVGMLVDVGTGKKRPGDVAGIIRARNRAAVNVLAPPHGLSLWEVGY